MTHPPSPISRRSLLVAGAYGLAGVAIAQALPYSHALAAPTNDPRREWEQRAKRLAQSIRKPQFPNRETRVDLTSTSETLDSRGRIQRAIDELNTIGGGRVVIPSGEWNIAGPIRLTSNIDLHLEKGATLRFSTDPKDYLPAVLTRWEGTELFGYSPLIYAYHAHNIAITGLGTINGNRSSKGVEWEWDQGSQQRDLREMGREGEPVYERKFGRRGMLQPSLIQFFGCSSILVDGITTVEAPLWGIHLVYSNDATIRNVRVESLKSNNDGIDVDSSHRVLIEGCVFKTGDDCIAIKSGRDHDGRFVAVPSENIVIRNCAMDLGKSAALAIGSEMSGGIRDVYMYGCTMGTVDTVVDVKSNLDRVSSETIQPHTTATPAENSLRGSGISRSRMCQQRALDAGSLSAEIHWPQWRTCALLM